MESWSPGRSGQEVEILITAPLAVYSGYPPAEFFGSATIVRVDSESPPMRKRAGIGVRFNEEFTFRTLFSAAQTTSKAHCIQGEDISDETGMRHFETK